MECSKWTAHGAALSFHYPLGMPHKRHRRQTLAHQTRSISSKVNRVLNIILLALLLIILRIWHLSVVQHEVREEESRRPQVRTVIESAKRGTIIDRFGVPLAINRLQYNAALLYAPLRQIPSVRWEIDANGQRIKRYKRREYISSLSKLLAETLGFDAARLEDIIHSKGALYNQIPYILKEDISEREYYELKALERDWPGIQVQRVPRRYYPLGRVAGDIIGYMGAINRSEYEKIIAEIDYLQTLINTQMQESEPSDALLLSEEFDDYEKVLERLQALKDKAYMLVDYVGKTGIEGRFERELRGKCGKKSYCSDARGNFLRELPGSRQASSGNRLQLTISAELQEFAEQLLIQNEQIRETRFTLLDATKKKLMALKKPWIKGGAIVVMDPLSGEVIVLASYPRYDPNDFILSGNSEIKKVQRANISRWFEAESHIEDIWDQRSPLAREYYDYTLKAFSEEKKMLTWETYLEIILPPGSLVTKALTHDINVAKAIEINTAADGLLASTGMKDLLPLFEKLFADDVPPDYFADNTTSAYQRILKTNLGEPMTLPERLLCVDLCRLVLDETLFTPELIKSVGSQKLSNYRDACAAMVTVEEVSQAIAKEIYRDFYFVRWRRENEKEFLKQKRLEEKAQNRYAKPYIDLLDAKEEELFKEFWMRVKWQLIDVFLTGRPLKSDETECVVFLDHFACWHAEIARGAHQQLYWQPAYQKMQEIILSVAPDERLSYLRSLRGYRQLTRTLLSVHEPLFKRVGQPLEKHLAAAFYPPYGYGYGRSQAYRQATTQGSLFKLVTAYEALIQRYDLLGAKSPTPAQLNPLMIVDAPFTQGKESYLGYFSDGMPLPRLYKGGRLPRSVKTHLGQLDLLTALEVSNNAYFSLLAGDVLSSSNDLSKAAQKFAYGSRTGIDLPAEISGKIPTDLETNRSGLYAMAIGQHTFVVTPLQTSVMLTAFANGGKVLIPQLIKNKDFSVKPKFELPMPMVIRKMLLEGMQRVVIKSFRENRYSLSRLYKDHPEAITDFMALKDQILGKTGTAESIERLDLDRKKGLNMYHHVWFGGIAFDQNNESFMAKDPFGTPEIVVVVYLRYGGFGKEAEPVAAQIVAKWRELKAKYMARGQRP